MAQRKRKNTRTDDYLRNIIRYSPGFMYLKDTQFKYILCNENFAQIAGLQSPEEIVGKTDYDLVWKHTQANLFRQGDIETLSGVKKINFEEPQLQADGETRVVLANKVPLLDKQNNIIGILGNYLDITEQKQLASDLTKAKEKAEIADQAKTEFLENMRHDIRTPLTGIVGFSNILMLESDNLAVKEYAANLIASSHALLDLLDEVLDAIRVGSGEIPILREKFNLQSALQPIIELHRAKAAQKKLTLTFDFDASIPTYVLGDKKRLHRIALELIANALNFTATGFVKLSVNLAKVKQRELIIKLIVQDTGIGIPEDKQQEIYVQFKRLTPSYKGIYKGAGLGLAVVKQFIDELDGEIYLNSSPGKGAKFTCVIPLQKPLLEDCPRNDENQDEYLS